MIDECQRHVARSLQAGLIKPTNILAAFRSEQVSASAVKYRVVKLQMEFDETSQIQQLNCGGLLNVTAAFPVLVPRLIISYKIDLTLTIGCIILCSNLILKCTHSEHQI